MSGTRPGGVTVVSILAWLSGLLQIIGGVVILLTGVDAQSGSPVLTGWLAIALGLITVFVAIGLWRGNRVARVLATIVFVLSIIHGVGTMFTVPSNAWSALVSALIALIGIILLWTRAASAFFRR